MSTITKKDLVDRIVENAGIARVAATAVVQCFLEEIISELAKGNRLEFRDFGVFEVREQAARTAQNPKTLEPVDVPARRRVKFKMGRPTIGQQLASIVADCCHPSTPNERNHHGFGQILRQITAIVWI